jgi:hypothetical protein
MELYSHVPVMREIVQALQRWGFIVCGVYVLDSQFMADPRKFISGCLACLSAMVQLEIPHVNVILTKMGERSVDSWSVSTTLTWYDASVLDIISIATRISRNRHSKPASCEDDVQHHCK